MGKFKDLDLRHSEGESTGSFIEIEGGEPLPEQRRSIRFPKVRTYVAKSQTSTKRGIVFLPDAFGVDLINSQLLADDFASNGFTVL